MIKDYLRGARPDGIKGNGDPLYDCPRCHGRNRLEVSRKKRVWYCHKCGRGGLLDSCRAAGRSRLGESKLYSMDDFTPAQEESSVVKFLRLRGLTEEMVSVLDPHKGPNALSCCIPVYAWKETTPSLFVARSTVNGVEPKYYNYCVQRRSTDRTTFFWHRRSDCLRERIVFTEGILDAVQVYAGVATLGKSSIPKAIQVAKALQPGMVFICFDGDAGQKARELATKLVRNYSGKVYVVDLPMGEDPGSLGGQETEKYIGRATRYA